MNLRKLVKIAQFLYNKCIIPGRGLSFGSVKPLQNSNKNQGFQVFSDENSSSGISSTPEPSGDLSAPFSRNMEAENTRKAGKWNNAKVWFEIVLHGIDTESLN